MSKNGSRLFRFCNVVLASVSFAALAVSAQAQLQPVGEGVSVDLSVLGDGSGSYTQPPYATAAPGANPGSLRMPSGQILGSTFYGLNGAANADRLPGPAPRRTVTAPAPDPMVNEASTQTASAPTAPAPAPEAIPAPAAIPEPTLTAEAQPAPPPAPPTPEPVASVAPAAPPPPAPSAVAPPEPVATAPAPEPAQVAAAPAIEAPTAPPDTGLTRLIFSTGDSKATPAAKESLTAIGSRLLADDALRLEIRAFAGGDGMTDNRARRLSLARALAVRSQLIDQGIRPNRIDVRALGNKTDEQPLDRVDLALSSTGG